MLGPLRDYLEALEAANRQRLVNGTDSSERSIGEAEYRQDSDGRLQLMDSLRSIVSVVLSKIGVFIYDKFEPHVVDSDILSPGAKVNSPFKND